MPHALTLVGKAVISPYCPQRFAPITPMLLTYLTLVAIGFVTLAWSADRLVEGASSLARQLNVSAFAIGVVILGFGTSLPELLVSAMAAASGSGGIAIGNAFGSNIANIALILGVTALILPLTADRTLIRRDIPLILFGTAGVFLVLQDLALERWEGFCLMLALVGVITWIVRSGRAADPIASPSTEHTPLAALALISLGLTLLLGSSWALVWAATGLARMLGVDELLIGLTLVAIGTSLPELAASLASLKRAEGSGLILGNVIGSNLFNTLGVVGLPAAIRPFKVSPMLWHDSLIMLALTASLGFLLLRRAGFRLNRPGAILLLLCYIVYLGWNAERMMAPA